MLKHVDYSSRLGDDALVRQLARPSCVQSLVCRVFWAEPLINPLLAYCWFDPRDLMEIQKLSYKQIYLKMANILQGLSYFR